MLDFLNERFYYNDSIFKELKYTFWVGSLITFLLVLFSLTQTSFSQTEVLIFSIMVVFVAMLIQYSMHTIIIKFGWHKQWFIHDEVSKIFLYLLLIATYLFAYMSFLGLISTTILEFSVFVGITSLCGIIPISIRTLLVQNNRLTQQLRFRELEDDFNVSKHILLNSPNKSDSFTCERANLLYFKSDENYLLAVEKNKKTHIRLTMKSAMEQLGNVSFLRVHRSYLVNTQLIKKIKSKHLILDGNVYVPISRQFRKEFVEKQIEMS